MIDALQISQSGLRATQQWIDLISNNISNSQTVGFKKSGIQFVDVVSGLTDARAATAGGGNVRTGMGTQVYGTSPDFTLGSLKATEKPLDVAINGDGFLEVILDNGTRAYTKVGRLAINDDGRLMLATGEILSDDIYIPPDITKLSITEHGIVEGRSDDSTDIFELGEIRLASIVNPGDLTSLGKGLYQTSTQDGDVVQFRPGEGGVGKLVQGYVEMSNVSLIEEMSNLVLAQRAYQLNARLIQVADSILETANNIRR